ncbi:uncharacterized protein LOC122870422 isoform X2 [Siniperca chuatsi]|uniref:uncharacterized protein LOC122870422 isoform X2 n=1 Tax=Siniperca chuatsi TaxID=119488 RepID=UPI001CE20836|nr:uncharacterized protein LOC122870422 isoform X2 [Siniperca chuatsi]
MSYNEGHCVRSRQPVLPPFSNRTLHHPSLLPLYMAAHPHADCNNQTVHPIIPAEFFYTDPTMSCGRRIPNIVSQLRVFDCFQLNTPPPVMSACLAPPTRPDPFRSGPHPTRDLGSPTLTINTLHPPVQPSQVILQLTQEEDQAITNLLKLHHQEPIQRVETLTAPQMDLNPIPFLSHPEPMEVYKPFCSDVQHPRGASLQDQLQQGRCWSDRELEAANTLSSHFSLMEKEKIRGQNHNKSAATLPDPLPYRRHEDSSINTETQQGSETLPALITTDRTQNDIGYISFTCVSEHGEPGCGDLGFVEGRSADDVHLPIGEEYLASSLPPRLPSRSSEAESRSSVSGDFSEVKERTLSDCEGDAVHVLLSLGDMGALAIVQ